MISCYIVDDEQGAIDVLVHFIKQVPSMNLIGYSTNPIEALEILSTIDIDLFFVDIQMPGLTGIDFIKAVQGKSKFILTTAFGKYALDAYDLDVVDYLLKPVPFTRFLRAVHKVMKSYNPEKLKSIDDFIFVKTETKGKVLRINLCDIDFIESKGHYVAINRKGENIMVYMNLKDLTGKLPASEFIRVHKSFIIPVSKILGIEGNKLQLKDNNADITVGDNFKPMLMQLIKDRMIN